MEVTNFFSFGAGAVEIYDTRKKLQKVEQEVEPAREEETASLGGSCPMGTKLCIMIAIIVLFTELSF